MSKWQKSVSIRFPGVSVCNDVATGCDDALKGKIYVVEVMLTTDSLEGEGHNIAALIIPMRKLTPNGLYLPTTLCQRLPLRLRENGLMQRS